MNHKRRRPKHRRAGCLMCKPHKDERGKGGWSNWVRRQSELRARADEVEQRNGC